jgi:hypothetical protein
MLPDDDHKKGKIDRKRDKGREIKFAPQSTIDRLQTSF